MRSEIQHLAASRSQAVQDLETKEMTEGQDMLHLQTTKQVVNRC